MGGGDEGHVGTRSSWQCHSNTISCRFPSQESVHPSNKVKGGPVFPLRSEGSSTGISGGPAAGRGSIGGQVAGRSAVAAGAFSCSKCDRVFAARAHLDRHMPVHS